LTLEVDAAYPLRQPIIRKYTTTKSFHFIHAKRFAPCKTVKLIKRKLYI
jgi:hypothetical protein